MVKYIRIMKTVFKTAIYLSVLLAASSCVLDDIDTQITDEQALASAKLECDALESYSVAAEHAKTVYFRINSNTPWSIVVPEEAGWLTVTPISSDVSSLSGDISVKAANNAGYIDREATITVKARDIDTKYTVTIRQTRSGELEITPFEGEFDKTGSTLPFSFACNNNWTVSAADEWLTFDKTSGENAGAPETVTVQATAAVNPAVIRTTTVTVKAGDLTETFEATQNGETLEFVTTGEAPSVSRKGGETLLDVNATIDWKVECEDEGVTVERVDNQVKVSAPWNNRLTPRTITVVIKPTASGFEGISASAEVTQDSNFELQGNYTVLEDGSVKMSAASSGTVTKATFKDACRYMDLTLTFGEKNFGASGQLWVQTKLGAVNIYNQLSLDGNKRIRTDGNLADEAGTSAYASSNFTVTASDLNAMNTYHYKTTPKDGDSTRWNMVFEIDGTQKVLKEGPNPYYYDPGYAKYWFGFTSNTTDGTYYVIKTCDVTSIVEFE